MTVAPKAGIVPLLRETVGKWQRDECLRMGATLAYYALFSLFPLLLVILGVFGFFVGPGSGVRAEILRMVQQAGLPPLAFGLVEGTLNQLSENRVNAGVIGFVMLLFSASGVFGELSHAFDVIWAQEEQKPARAGLRAVVIRTVLDKLLAFALVVASALLVFVSMLVNVALGVIQLVIRDLPGSAFAWALTQIASQLLLLSLALVLLFKFLPNDRPTFRDVFPGALLTAVLFFAIQQSISSVGISIGSNFESYGVVGGVMALMTWIYLVSQILFLGGEFTYVYTYMFGSRRDGSA